MSRFARTIRARLLLQIEDQGEQPILDSFAHRHVFPDVTIQEWCTDNEVGVYVQTVLGTVTKTYSLKGKEVHREESQEPVRSDGHLNSYTFYVFYKLPERD